MNDFVRKLMKSVHRKNILPKIPSFVVMLPSDEMASLVLDGSGVSHKKIEDNGLQIEFSALVKSISGIGKSR